MTTPTPSTPRIGIALGGGSARGWAHIGVLAALAERGIEPDIVCGTSIGALVGGVYAAGKLPELEEWVKGLKRRDVLGLVDFTIAGGGVLGGRRLIDLYRQHLGEVRIEELPRRYAAVATDLESGSEVWLQDGPLLDAIRASISLPGVFTPVRRDGRWLADGALVNPVPVSLCRALGAELVIAVDLHAARKRSSASAAAREAQPAVVRSRIRERTTDEPAPAFSWVIQSALDIMQIRLSRARLAGDPPDLLLTPRVLQVPMMEFVGGKATIDEGRSVVRRMLPALDDLVASVRAS